MNITLQTVQNHYQQLLGLSKEWVVERVDVDHATRILDATLCWNPKLKLRCAKCGRRCPCYDHLPVRTWRHTDACGYVTLLHARVPRSECPQDGVVPVVTPWAEPSGRFTLDFERYAIEVLEAATNVTQASKLLRIDWSTANSIKQRAVQRGLTRRQDQSVRHLGIDEKSFGKGHSYGTVLSDLEGKRVLEVVKDRTEQSAREALLSLPEAVRQSVEAVALDMWKPFINAAQEVLPQAALVHDKFHIVAMLGEGVDTVRRQEQRQLRSAGDETLTGTKYLWLMNPANFTDAQEASFLALVGLETKVARAWSIRQLFVYFWDSPSVAAGRLFFKKWYGRTKRSKLEPMKKVADTIHRHLHHVLTYFTHRITNAAAEGLNSTIQTIKANARGYRSFANYRISILFHLGKLSLYP
jgi:transposase